MDADLLALPEWDYDKARAVTRVDTAFYRDIPVQTKNLFVPTVGAWPVIPNGAVNEVRHPMTIIDIGNTDLGDAPHTLDLTGFRFMEGEAAQGRPRATYLQEQIRRLSLEIARPFGYGAPELLLYCTRGSAGDARPGDIRKVDCDAVLDPATNVRGGVRVIRVVAREEKGPGIEIRGLDLGSASPAAVPTLGVPTVDADNRVSVLVTFNAVGDPVHVHYAVTDTDITPAETSPLWSPDPALQFLKLAGTGITFPMPAGRYISIRGRSFPTAAGGSFNLPSAWVVAGRVLTNGLAAPSVPASANVKARSFRVTWTNGSASLGTELLLATPTTDARVVVARLPAGTTRYDFPGGTGLDILPSTTYRVGIRHYQDSPASVSAEVTVDVTTTATLIFIPPPIFRPWVGQRILI